MKFFTPSNTRDLGNQPKKHIESHLLLHELQDDELKYYYKLMCAIYRNVNGSEEKIQREVSIG